jgi:dipeptidyl aminopeptidase/acylaminoacyl peptidase
MTSGVETEKLPMPELIRWKNIDGRMISAFLYFPPTMSTGKRHVVIDIHRGPVDQYHPGSGGNDDFFISELGIARVYPDMRDAQYSL